MRSGVFVCCIGKSSDGTVGYINNYLKGYTHHPGERYMPRKVYAPEKGKLYMAIKYSGPTDDDYVVDKRKVLYNGTDLSKEELLKEAGLYADQGYYRPHIFTAWKPEQWVDGIDDIRNTLLWAPVIKTDAAGVVDIVFHTSDIASTFVVCGYAFGANGRYGDMESVVFEVK